MADIKRNKENISKFKKEMTEMGVKKTVKTMKVGEDKFCTLLRESV